MRVGFFDADTLETGEIVVEEIDTAFYAVIANGNDSVFYDPNTRASVFTVPVDPADDMTAFEFYMIDSVATDTISDNPLEIEVTYFPNPAPYLLDVSYRRVTSVITEDCGVEIIFVRVEVSETTFAGYEIEIDNLNRFNEPNEKVNVKVYF